MSQTAIDFDKLPHNGTTTSKAAATVAAQSSTQVGERIVAYLRERGALGATCEEIEDRLRLKHQTASARLRGLFLAKRVRHIGVRPTRSGCAARVYYWAGLPA